MLPDSNAKYLARWADVTELSSHGLDVDWVDNGREGLERAVSGDYDLITLDRMLPELDGLA
ncbi:hypothetical protein SB772_40500, partial [Paraburkholderia sp. SIMBA_030]